MSAKVKCPKCGGCPCAEIGCNLFYDITALYKDKESKDGKRIVPLFTMCGICTKIHVTAKYFSKEEESCNAKNVKVQM